MRSRNVRIFFLLIFILISSVGYIKGCNSPEYPKQHPLPDSLKKKPVVIPKDSAISVAAGKQYEKSEFHELFFGTHYRDLWAECVKVPVFDIAETHGGMKVIKRGGNMQTLNLRLESKDGKMYTMRTIDKDQSKVLPRYVRNKVFVSIVRDQTSALNPYGALVIPPLAEAAGILHTNPRIYFIPYDPNFGKYADLMEGRVVLLEEFPDETWVDTDVFGGAKDIVSSAKMLSERFTSTRAAIDERAFARARLFDLWINDWDRHSGQWRWAEFGNDSQVVFRPVPRDRDIAFYKFNSGLLPKLVLIFNDKFQSFGYDFENISGLIKNGTYLDNLVLNGMSEEEFVGIARDLKCRLTDSVITSAIRHWPREVFAMEGGETISKLKVRRNKLEDAAKEYYKLLYKEVTIAGTDEREKFIVERKDDHHTAVTILDEHDHVYYQHVFDHRTTNEITLYGLNGEDVFLVKGKVNKGILVNLYGGMDNDEYRDESFVKGYKKKTRIYDTKADNLIEGGEETDDQTSSDPDVLFFERSGARR